ncbi:hypothetical protein JCM1393_05520 [Clostridium carnis]
MYRKINNEVRKNIIEGWINSKITRQQLAKKYNVSRSFVYKITKDYEKIR